jgi:proteasome-associated ATPase
MSDRRPADQQDPEPNGKTEAAANQSTRAGTDPLELIEQCLASFPDGDPRQKILYKLRHAVILGQAAQQQREVEFKKVADVIAKLTAPANRVGTLLEVPGEGLARILVGGAEYYASVDPRVLVAELKIGAQILVNEAYAVIKILGYDRNGPVLKVAEALADGRLRFEQEMGRQVLILQRSSDLIGVDLKAGDEVRIDSTLHVAIEKLEDRKAKSRLLDEVPSVTWEQIGGQAEAIAAIQKAIEYPLLHAETFQRFKFTQPKGFLLYGPPGCGKTLIGQAAAASLSKLVGESSQGASDEKGGRPPVTRGAFLHIKGSGWFGIFSPRPGLVGARGHCPLSLLMRLSRFSARGGHPVHSISPVPWCRCSVQRWTESNRCTMW